MIDNKAIQGAMTIQLGNEYPDYPEFKEGIRRAPDRGFRLTKEQTKIALKNALRYVPEELHEKLAPSSIGTADIISVTVLAVPSASTARISSLMFSFAVWVAVGLRSAEFFLSIDALSATRVSRT